MWTCIGVVLPSIQIPAMTRWEKLLGGVTVSGEQAA